MGTIISPSNEPRTSASSGIVMPGRSGPVVGTAATQASGGKLNPSFVCSRANQGTAESLQGVYTLFAPNQIRTTNKGTLIEELRTGTILQSQAFDQSPWTVQNGPAIIANTTLGPDGSTTGDTCTDNSSNAAHDVFQSSLTTVNTSRYTLSEIVKAGTRGTTQLAYSSAGFSGNPIANFDATNGVQGTTAGTGLVGASMASLALGWYRNWMIATSDGSSSAVSAFLAMTNSSSAARLAAYVGTGDTLNRWHAQFETGDFPSSPMVGNAGSTITRAADIITAQLLGVPTGTIYIDVIAPPVAPGGWAGAGATQVACQWDGGTENDRIRIHRDSSKVMHFIVTVGGVDQCDISLGTLANNGRGRIAVTWGFGGFTASLNGRTASTVSSGSAPNNLITFRLGSDSAGANFWNGWIISRSNGDRVEIFNTRKTTAELVAFSKYPLVRSPKPRVFYNCDFESDVDDVMDFLMLLALEKRGEIEIAGICVTSANTLAAPTLYAILNFYGRTSIQVGQDTADAGTASSAYATFIVTNYGVPGKLTAANFPSGASIFRSIFAIADDNSLDVLMTGGGTSFSNMLDSAADSYSPLNGIDLVTAKARACWPVAGLWPSGVATSDMGTTRTAYQNIFNKCPVPVYLADLTYGNNILIPGTVMESLAANNPARVAWEQYISPGDVNTSTRPSWSGPTILSIARGCTDHTYLPGENGTASVNAGTGATLWKDGPNRQHGYLNTVMSDAGLISAISSLVSTGP